MANSAWNGSECFVKTNLAGACLPQTLTKVASIYLGFPLFQPVNFPLFQHSNFHYFLFNIKRESMILEWDSSFLCLLAQISHKPSEFGTGSQRWKNVQTLQTRLCYFFPWLCYFFLAVYAQTGLKHCAITTVLKLLVKAMSWKHCAIWAVLFSTVLKVLC